MDGSKILETTTITSLKNLDLYMNAVREQYDLSDEQVKGLATNTALSMFVTMVGVMVDDMENQTDRADYVTNMLVAVMHAFNEIEGVDINFDVGAVH